MPHQRTSVGRVISGILLLLCASNLSADDQAQREFFESKIRPLLIDKCQSCHEGEAAESKLRVDSLDGLLQGGTRGASVVPGKPAESLLISAVKHGEVLKMPPKEKLSAAQIADLSKWVESGAYWPDAKPITTAPNKPVFAEPEFTPEQRTFWAFQRPQKPAIPNAVREGDFRSPVDRFLDVKLAEAGYAAAAPLSQRLLLLRRATFDLIGLPPQPEEIDEFLADESPDALERVLDRLLASPHYGEKWGRHWLDVARYGDSNGLDENLAYANAFRYRDYVIASFNKDKPYNEFIHEQLAGDLMPFGNDVQKSLEQITATGFLSIGPKMLAEDDPVKMQMDIIDEQVDTLGKAFLGMTFGCARCHHHKFDPISAHDYYALAGIFKSTKTMDNFSVVARWQERQLASTDQLHEWNRQKDLIAAKQTDIEKLVAATNERIQAEARRHLGDYLLAAAQHDRLDQLLAARKPFGERADVSQIPGAILIEAENFTRGNVLQDTANYGAGIGVLVNKGEAPNYAEFDLELPDTGKYQIELRYAAAEARPCRLMINGKELRSDAASKATGGWFPDHQAWHFEGVYELPAGKITVRLEHKAAFPHIDKLLIVPAPDVPTTASFVRLQADYAVLPIFVEQWRKQLSKPESDFEKVFAPWQEASKKLADDASVLPELARLAAEFQQRAGQFVEMKNDDDPLAKILHDPKGPFAIPADQEPGYPPETVAELSQLREEKKTLEAALPVYPEAMAVSDQTPEELRIHFRGSHLTLGELVSRRFPRIFAGAGASLNSSSSGRLELANWLTQADHPLTSRVIVNRVWTWHFGQGIVRSADNFGLLGELPTHPELLDWLAVEFPRNGWSFKRLHRDLMTTAAYQRSGNAEAVQQELDPENRFWGRFPRRRLAVEELRDAILATAGMLDSQMEGTLLPTKNRQYVTSTANVNPKIYETNRRTIYLPIVRSALFDVFQAFDFADPNVSSGQRQTTTIAPQALFLMNSAFVAQQSLTWAEELLALDDSQDELLRLQQAYRRALGRNPTADDVARAAAYLADYQKRAAAENMPVEEARRRSWQSFCRALLSTNEFVYVE